MLCLEMTKKWLTPMVDDHTAKGSSIYDLEALDPSQRMADINRKNNKIEFSSN